MATVTFKLIKKTPFKTEKAEGIAYVVGYKGRALNISTLSFEEGDIKEEKDKVIVNGEIEVVKRPYINAVGDSVMGLTVMPKLGLELMDI